jgi:predicted GNAT family acetyltransferase
MKCFIASPWPEHWILPATTIQSVASNSWIYRENILKAKNPQQVTSGRFELEREGHTGFIDYSLAGKILQLIHTEVPEALQGKGVASELAKSALDYARENNLKVDPICPFISEYIGKHPEYAPLVVR